MPNIKHLYLHVRHYGMKHHALYVVCFMIFFFLLFDGMLMFHVPLIITNAGISETNMGLIVGFSSVAGIIFDLLLTHVLKKANFRRMFLMMLAIASLFPLILWKGEAVLWLMLGMIVWGIYFDLYNCGTLDFVGRMIPKEEHTSSFGVIDFFISTAYLIAPLIASVFTAEIIHQNFFFIAWGFLGIAILFYFALRRIAPIKEVSVKKQKNIANLFVEFALHKKVAVTLFPLYLFSTMLTIIEASFWIVAPLIVIQTDWSIAFAGVFLFAHGLPSFLVGWLVGDIVGKRSKKRTAFTALLIGSLIMVNFLYVRDPILLILLSFLSAICTGIAWPVIKSIFADYVSEAKSNEQEIELVQDVFTNIGFILGPAVGGFLAATVGHIQTFGVVGIVGALLAVSLLIFTPRHINIAKALGVEQI
jgi:predicted MFS family arabinose efflux permease